jgi:hypothetical protein
MGGIDSAQDWHGNIGHYYVGKKAEYLRHHCGAIRCSHHVKLRLQGRNCGFPYGRMIIRQQYAWSYQVRLPSEQRDTVVVVPEPKVFSKLGTISKAMCTVSLLGKSLGCEYPLDEVRGSIDCDQSVL